MPYVLVVDDEAPMVRLVSRVLADAGFDVAAALHPAEALAYVVDRVPDAIVTDFEMPGMNGATMMERIRGMLLDAAPPAVLISGALDAVHPRQRGLFVAELSKPFRAEELRAAVALCLDEAADKPRRKRSGTRMRAVESGADTTSDDESQTG